jgi:hypothetical protein
VYQALNTLRLQLEVEQQQQETTHRADMDALLAERDRSQQLLQTAEQARTLAEQQLLTTQQQLSTAHNALAELQAQTVSIQELEAEHQATLGASKQQQLLQQQTLQQTHQKEINDYVALLQEAERRRATAEELSQAVSTRLKAEKTKADEMVRQNVFLEKLATKSAEAKTRLTERSGFLMEAVERMCGTWQADKYVWVVFGAFGWCLEWCWDNVWVVFGWC